MAEVWFVRHGESAANAGEVVHDMASVPLTGKGWAQARNLSTVFSKAPDLIITTPYLRTQQTAQDTRARFPDVPHETWPLQEFAALGHAKYNGTTLAERLPHYRAIWVACDPDYVDGDGAESFAAMVKRVRDALELLRQRPEAHIVVFAHGHIMQAVKNIAENPNHDARQLMAAMGPNGGKAPMGNCEILRIVADAQGIRPHVPLHVPPQPPAKAALRGRKP